jgi:hypothetical protein
MGATVVTPAGIDRAAERVERGFDAMAWRAFFAVPRSPDAMRVFVAMLERRAHERDEQKPDLALNRRLS